MARTKQTARKTTGGKAPRKVLGKLPRPASGGLAGSNFDGVSEDEETDEDQASSKPQKRKRHGQSDVSKVAGMRSALETLLSKGLNFKGTYAFARTYPDAPIPCLSLSELGTIGLPLSDREAQHIIDRCVQAPFGKGERTVVDKEVRDTWEMDASKVMFQNPEWQDFISRIVKDVSEALGVDVKTSKPRAELYKLLVYETGSHTEKSNGMFATIVVVLPTTFTGGDAHLSHSGMSTVFNSSSTSLSKASVLAWYTDVTHEIKPITSGYRVALAYNLVHTSNAIRPSPSSISPKTINGLRNIFQTWRHSKQGAEDSETGVAVPNKIVFQLSHKYSQQNLSASALKGNDAYIVAVLDPLARELGICLGLAGIQLTLSGPADDYHGDCSSPGFEETPEREATIDNLVDLEGRSIAIGDLDFNEDETVPLKLLELLENKRYDGKDYEGYLGNGAGTLAQFYRRSALVIWPPRTRLGVGCADRRALHAISVLSSPSGSSPSEEESILFNYLCGAAAYVKRDLLLPPLGTSSRHWNDVDRWTRALRSSNGPVGDNTFIDEVKAATLCFGFTNVSECIRASVLADDSNTSCSTFLSALEGMCEHPDFEESKTQVASFTKSMRPKMLYGKPAVGTQSQGKPAAGLKATQPIIGVKRKAA